MVSITIDGVTKLFGDVRAVDDVSLEIGSGELFFLLGPSGCGKTTLLRMIAGFYYPENGRILFDDRDVARVPPHRRNTGMVFQNYALWPHMTVRQNLAFGLEMHGMAEDQRRESVDRALERVQMGEYGDRTPNQLSGGQQQRVALARALVLEPDAVLLDEPLSNLDARLRLEMRAHIKHLHEALGLTMVYVTHDQGEALSMANRMAIMRHGRVVQLGTPREVYHRPASRFVADFIGETNILPGRLAEVGTHFVADTAVGRVAAAAAYDGAAVGDAVLCSMRPESLDVLVGDGARPNEMSGRLVRVFFLGDHEQFFVELADGTEVRALEFDTGVSRGVAGETVRLGCRPEDVVILPAED